MNIVWVTSEAVPFAKTGGLADVSGALPEALAQRGHHVSIIMPYYPQQMAKLNLKFDRSYDLFAVPFWNGVEWASIHRLKLKKNLTCYFIEFNRFYDRPRLYDWDGKEYDDNAARFIFLSRAAMEAVKMLDLKPDILHTNDWHAALCCVYLKSGLYAEDSAFANCRSVITIHNIGYQGIFHKFNLYLTGLGWEYFNYTCLEYHDQLNFLKAGIMTADMVNAVSPTYAAEILSPEYSFGLESALRSCASRAKLRGILNGIDVSVWNPAKDKLLPQTFSANSPDGKAVCKQELQKHFNLPVTDKVPVFSVISRFAYQKGLDIFAACLEDILYHQHYQFIVIGSGDANLENWYRYLAGKYPEKLVFFSGYAPDKVTHLVEAGSDFFVMPSRYEPCGLNQMYSMCCGTLPIVRHTGGLADTVSNYNENDFSKSNGFVFWDLYPEALRNTILWAGNTWYQKPDAISRMRHNAMKQDFSWNRTASEYERMYDDAHR